MSIGNIWTHLCQNVTKDSVRWGKVLKGEYLSLKLYIHISEVRKPYKQLQTLQQNISPHCKLSICLSEAATSEFLVC